MTIDKKLIEILQCPDCSGNIQYLKKKQRLMCKKCQRIFDMKDNIPVMLPKANKFFT